MGWWKIRDVESGMIDWSHKCPTNEALANAAPGQDAKNLRYNGDGPADAMEEALKKVNGLYEETWGRAAYREELQAVFNFVANGTYREKPTPL